MIHWESRNSDSTISASKLRLAIPFCRDHRVLPLERSEKFSEIPEEAETKGRDRPADPRLDGFAFLAAGIRAFPDCPGQPITGSKRRGNIETMVCKSVRVIHFFQRGVASGRFPRFTKRDRLITKRKSGRTRNPERRGSRSTVDANTCEFRLVSGPGEHDQAI